MASLNLADPDPEPPVESGEHPKKEAARAKWQSQWQAHHTTAMYLRQFGDVSVRWHGRGGEGGNYANEEGCLSIRAQ